MANVNFFREDCDYIITNQDVLERWLREIIQKENKKTGEINIILCSDAYLLDLNKKYLKRDTLTDVIAFDYNEEEIINGDIFISIDRIRENAMDFGVDEKDELHRVMAHGLLHLIGYQDETKAKKQGMKKLEDDYLNLLNGST